MTMLSLGRIAEIRAGVPLLPVGSFSVWYGNALRDVLAALDAAEADNGAPPRRTGAFCEVE